MIRLALLCAVLCHAIWLYHSLEYQRDMYMLRWAQRILALLCAALWLSGCSVAALINEHDLNQRMTAMDARLSALEAQHTAAR